MAKTSLTRNQKAYYTRMFNNQQNFDSLNKKATQSQKVAEVKSFSALGIAETVLGNYFDSVVYRTIATEFSTSKSTKLQYTQSHITAMKKISETVSTLSGEDLRKATDLLNRITAQAIKAGKEMAKRFESSLAQGVKPRIVVEGDSSKLGDAILSQIGSAANQAAKDSRHILEIKWQNRANTMFRWFGLVDSSLFPGYTYSKYLKNNNYLNHTIPETEWITMLEQSVLQNFLSDTIGDTQAIANYLLSKGSSSASVPDKTIIHGGNEKSTVSIVGLNELAEKLGGASTQTTSALNTFIKSGGIEFSKSGETLATFGTTEFKDFNSDSAAPDINSLKFTFQMYISQKLMRTYKI